MLEAENNQMKSKISDYKRQFSIYDEKIMYMKI